MAAISITAVDLPDLQTVAKAVRKQNADLGLAFDGDADRVLAVDHTGELVDGDQIIAICAADRHEQGRLLGDTVVVTVMTNLGFHRAMAQRGIHVVTTPVGDRHVWSALQDGELGARRRAVRPCHLSLTWPPPATACSPPCSFWR